MALVSQPKAGLSKSKPGVAMPTQSRDWYAVQGGQLLKAEKATDSVERMLAVCRSLMDFLVDLLRPGIRYADTPSVILGQHYLSHRDLGTLYRGDVTRAYVQELCSFDPVEGPIPCNKYKAPGHQDVARLNIHFVPRAQARLRKEGIIGSGLPYVEVALPGSGVIAFPRHAEEYTFKLPSIVLVSPCSEECPVDFDGTLSIECPATGLRADLRFKPWKDSQVKGEVTRLAFLGDKTQPQVVKIEGRWDDQVMAYGLEISSEGVLFDAADCPLPQIQVPVTVCLATPGPRVVPRFWSALLEALLYTDMAEAERLGKKTAELVGAIPGFLKKSLMYDIPEGPPRNSKASADDELSRLVARDRRPLPPASRAQHAMGRTLRYHLQLQVQAISQTALEEEIAELNRARGEQKIVLSSAASSLGTGRE